MAYCPHNSIAQPAEHPLFRIHTDTWGPQKVDGTNEGKAMVLTFTDEKTNLRFVYPIPNKKSSTILEKFIEFKNEVELQTGFKIRSIRSDEGTEYLGEMIQYCKRNDILHEPTSSYSPESNGKAEVQNRLIMNTVRAMQRQANILNSGKKRSKPPILFRIAFHPLP